MITLALASLGACKSSPGIVCGAGTTNVGGTCVVTGDAPLPIDAADAGVATGTHYEIRISESTIGANGHTKREVFVFGVQPDGTYASDSVVLSLDRASAGALVADALVLGPLGARTYFTPCNSAGAGCLGPATLAVALASAPAVPVATVAIDLVTPTHVSTAAPCRAGGNVMYFDGDDYIRNGMLTTELATWQGSPIVYNTVLSELQLMVGPTDITQGSNWNLWVDTYSLGTSLAPGIYLDAQRSHNTTTGHPGMQVFGNGRGCNTITGSFEVHDLVVAGSALASATVSFEQYCDGSTNLLEGCFHYGTP